MTLAWSILVDDENCGRKDVELDWECCCLDVDLGSKGFCLAVDVGVKTGFFKTILVWFPRPPFDLEAEESDFLLEISPKARRFILAPGVDTEDACLAEDVVFIEFSLVTSDRMLVDVEEDGRVVDRCANMMVYSCSKTRKNSDFKRNLRTDCVINCLFPIDFKRTASLRL